MGEPCGQRLQLRKAVGGALAILVFPLQRHAAIFGMAVAALDAGIDAGFEIAVKQCENIFQTEAGGGIGIVVRGHRLVMCHSHLSLPWPIASLACMGGIFCFPDLATK